MYLQYTNLHMKIVCFVSAHYADSSNAEDGDDGEALERGPLLELI